MPTSKTRAVIASFRSKVDASPIAIAVPGIAHGSATSSSSSRRPPKRRNTMRYAARKHTTTSAAVANADMTTLFLTGSQSCRSVASRAKFSSVYAGGSTCVVHAPSLAKETSTTIRCGRMRKITATTASAGASVRAARDLSVVRGIPFPDIA